METVEQELFHNKYRDSFDESLQNAIAIHHIDVKRKTTDAELRYMQMHLNGELDYDELKLLIKRFGEKTACLIICNGNTSEFESLKRDLKGNKDYLEEAEEKESPLYVSKDVGKELQSSSNGNYAPAHATHLGNGLGDNAGYNGYVWQLFVDGYMREITSKMVKKLFMDRYEILLTDFESNRITVTLNKERRAIEMKLLNSDIGESPSTKDAISIITKHSVKLGLDYEKTDRFGKEARIACSKFDHEAGKIIGKAKIDGDTPELEQRTARFFKNFIESNNMNANNCVALLTKMFNRKN